MLSTLFSDPFSAVLFLFAVIIAVTFHEFSHAWAATKLGDTLPESEGRLTLSPLAHLDLVGSLAFLIAGFGWGKPVSYNPAAFTRRSDEVLVALAGPISNLLLALIANILSAALVRVPGLSEASVVGGEIASVNVLLAAFNLIPLPPLDGSSVVAYFFPSYRNGRSVMIGSFALILLIIVEPKALGLIVFPVINAFHWLTTLGGIL